MEKKKNAFADKWHTMCDKMRPAFQAIGRVCQKVGSVFQVIASWAVRLRKVFMSIPVLIGMVYLAQYSTKHLPEKVGIGLQLNGEFLQTVSRDAAVLCPLAVTTICLVFMFCSRKTVYPWLISIFSLTLPVLILLTNLFPA